MAIQFFFFSLNTIHKTLISKQQFFLSGAQAFTSRTKTREKKKIPIKNRSTFILNQVIIRIKYN